MAVSPEKIHLFTTDKCNLRCTYCFREHFTEKQEEQNLEKIAEILTQTNTKRVVIGGGEPLLIKNLEKVLKILKKKDIYVDLHTNCVLLNNKKLKQLQGLVDKIGIPIDTLDKNLQDELRGHAGYVNHIKKITKNIQKLGFEIVFHTVAIETPQQKIPQLYWQFIKNQDFDCWKIYEYNDKLAMQSTELLAETTEDIVNYQIDQCDIRTGGTDSVLADFLLLEEKMQKYNDKRIRHIGVLFSTDYFFINSKGDAKYYTWFAPGRITFANLFKDDFNAVMKKFKQMGYEFSNNRSKDFFGTLQGMPLFARYWEGNYFEEELAEVDRKYESKFYHLADLWKNYVIRNS